MSALYAVLVNIGLKRNKKKIIFDMYTTAWYCIPTFVEAQLISHRLLECVGAVGGLVTWHDLSELYFLDLYPRISGLTIE